MGFTESTIIASALPSDVLPLASAMAVVVTMLGLLSAAAIGIWLAIPRSPRLPRRFTLVHSTAVN